jgi:enoyl-CoA hydratase/carnithine racemase
MSVAPHAPTTDPSRGEGPPTDGDAVLTERDGRTLVVSINRPHARNALTRPVVRGVTRAIEAAASDSEVRVVVLTGQGEHFCAGADLRRNLQDDPDFLDKLDAYLDEYHALIKAIVRSPKPSIAMIDGAAVGFGADLALACDLRVATERAYVQERFVKLGLMPDGGGSFWLPRLVGTARAMKMILLAEPISCKELHDLGVVTELATPEALRADTLALARRLEGGPPLAYAEVRSAVYASWGSIDDALRREREGQLRLLRTEDVLEGVMAWTQKRAPVFHGR